MKTIDINDWVVSGAGGRGTSYFHKSDPELMLKFDNGPFDIGTLEEELEAACVAYKLGIHTPEPGYVVTDGKRVGITFRRIANKVSYARAMGQNPERLEEIVASFVAEVKKLHATKADTNTMRSIKDIYGKFIRLNKYRTDAQKQSALQLLASLPDADTCLHGDLHYGNIIFGNGGSWFIDMGNFSYGAPMFDMAMLKAPCLLAECFPDVYVNLFHSEPSMATRFWNSFIKQYFGPDTDSALIDEMIKPYLLIRIITMETETGNNCENVFGPHFKALRAELLTGCD